MITRDGLISALTEMIKLYLAKISSGGFDMHVDFFMIWVR